MPDPRMQSHTRPADAGLEQDAVAVPTPQRRPLGLSLTQIAGGALAAVTAAVAASFLGVAGTLSGAAFGSVVSSIAAAVYSTSLSRAARASRVLVVRPGGLAADDPAEVPPPVGSHPEVLADAPAEAVTTPAGASDRQPSVWSRLRWRPVLLVAGTFFVAAMAVIVVTELVIGHPLSNSSKTGTTISNIGGSSGPSSPAPTSTPATSSTSGSASPSATPTGTPSPSDSPVPSEASPTGTAPATTPGTTEPGASVAPAPTAPTTSAPAPSPAAS
jgi:hypothetical protein